MWKSSLKKITMRYSVDHFCFQQCHSWFSFGEVLQPRAEQKEKRREKKTPDIGHVFKSFLCNSKSTLTLVCLFWALFVARQLNHHLTSVYGCLNLRPKSTGHQTQQRLPKRQKAHSFDIPGIILQDVLDRPRRGSFDTRHYFAGSPWPTAARQLRTRPAGFLHDEEDQTERRSHGTEPEGTEELRAALHSPDHTPLTCVATPRRRGGPTQTAGEGRGGVRRTRLHNPKRQSDTKTSRTAGLVFMTTYLQFQLALEPLDIKEIWSVIRWHCAEMFI